MRSFMRSAAAAVVVVAIASSSSSSSVSALSTSMHSSVDGAMSRTMSRSTRPLPSVLASSVQVVGNTLGDDTANKNELSPMLRDIVDEQRELQMNVGKAMDVLRRDYPELLRRAPDYDIYHRAIQVKDPAGVQLSELSSYRNALGAMRVMLGLVYDPAQSVVQSRMVYDAARCQIRVSFNASLRPKPMGLGGFGLLGGNAHGDGMVHVDGVSVYTIDRTRVSEGGEGKILEHKIETLLVNSRPIQPPYFGVFGLEQASPQGALVGAGAWNYEVKA